VPGVEDAMTTGALQCVICGRTYGLWTCWPMFKGLTRRPRSAIIVVELRNPWASAGYSAGQGMRREPSCGDARVQHGRDGRLEEVPRAAGTEARMKGTGPGITSTGPRPHE